jgi:2-phospho-L-lactate guanylyltransferase
MRATAVLPVKRFGEAKRRLATGIDDERREALVAAMLEDTLQAIDGARSIERTIVVTGDPRAQEIVAASSAEVLPDPADEGHVVAALAGIARAEVDGAACVALLPGDCPLLEPKELDRLLTGIPSSFVAVVPDRHGTGTNALVLSPPGAIEPAFGEGSRARHVAAAREASIPFAIEELPSLALDLDTPGDVVALTRALAAGSKRGRRTARVLGI